ncbi:hypothetical protein QQS21_002355 [Conoideocrella luteorostrata]|uniref:Uncharacterized protein n=1 Tax=Conoideocrella luteorostrata TaxID=1105319 RepID=A0AAJ0CWB3_9HYPO|nr:hypothetical protein QQS21_002355 [Conoideocrella luteorostrata]
MKFIAITLLAVATAAVAAPVNNNDDLVVRQDIVVDTQAPAMTDKQGNVVAFNSNGVDLANTDAGLE